MGHAEFHGCWERIERAKAHRKALGTLWESVVKAECFYQTSINVEGDGTGSIRVWRGYDLPPACPFELGETLYNLRAALDSSVYAAAIVQSGKNPPPNENRLQFPICATHGDFHKARRSIRPLSDECQRFIEAIQPYNTPELDDPRLLVLNLNRNIGILGDWSRKDRHRQLHVVTSWISEAMPKLEVPDGVSVKWLRVTGDGFLEDHNEIAAFELCGYTPAMKTQVYANPDLMIDIAVDEIPEPCAPNDTLGNRLSEMIVAVSLVVRTLEELAGTTK